MSYRRETAVEKRFCELATARGWLALKFVVPGRVGYPDRIVFKPGGEVFFVEMKSPDATRDAAHIARQKRRADELRALGFRVYVLLSIEDVESWFVDHS